MLLWVLPSTLGQGESVRQTPTLEFSRRAFQGETLRETASVKNRRLRGEGNSRSEVRRTAVLWKPSRLGVWTTICEALKTRRRLTDSTIKYVFFFPIGLSFPILNLRVRKNSYWLMRKMNKEARSSLHPFLQRQTCPVPSSSRTEGRLICECKLELINVLWLKILIS